ncbi:hypothetical protein [Bacillus badius]|uniref:Uncharacterized protein n=1 Tax=Bacillus badius TaxID=1455 RepID=A0ABR5AW82_BACBA|nr:hypothetical protein [Bacillus badius]KIL74526.1 hypothetical protein SD78_1595 [Bacillus badius]KIL78996.1 hypothetical protein SD77_3797 [Bacillus badius]KZR58823.1 hypothetical protein A3781_14860 [Bacillus badius]MED4715566.1 hypothetical protein [Bacillus badius]
MTPFLNEDTAVECTATATEYCWKKNVIKVDNGFLISKGPITNVRIPVQHIETVVYSMNPKKPALVPGLKIIGKGTVLAELDISAEYIESVQDWLLQVIERHSNQS